MDAMQETQNEQAARWNGAAGRAWVDAQELLDRLFAPLEQRLVEAAASASARAVLDVGCGTGATTLALARSGRQCIGIDISEPMLALARSRLERQRASVEFICADAQVYAFEPDRFDMIVSRFGVMFFGDPVQAFSNLRRASRRDAQIRLIVWRSAEENPFMTTAERAAAPLLPNLPTRPVDGPGQFAFANRERVTSILDRSGWSGIDIQPLDVECTLSEPELLDYTTRLGPVGLLLQESDEATRARVAGTIRGAFDPYVRGDRVHFNAACWMVSAVSHAPSA